MLNKTVIVLIGVMGSGGLNAPSLAGQDGDQACYELQFEAPEVLAVIRASSYGDTLTLRGAPAVDTAAVGETGTVGYASGGSRGSQEIWERKSWSFVRLTSTSIRIRGGGPWVLHWEASETAVGLEGEVTLESDVHGTPDRTTRFKGRRVSCTGGG